MTAEVLRCAGEIIGRATRERPADAVLREALRRRRGLAPAEARAISRAVFAYHRWFGWLDRKRPRAAHGFRPQDWGGNGMFVAVWRRRSG